MILPTGYGKKIRGSERVKDIEKFKKDLKTLLFTNFEEIKQKAFIYKPI